MPPPTLLDKLLDAPDLKLLVEKAENRLSEEAKRRHEFREWLKGRVYQWGGGAAFAGKAGTPAL